MFRLKIPSVGTMPVQPGIISVLFCSVVLVLFTPRGTDSSVTMREEENCHPGSLSANCVHSGKLEEDRQHPVHASSLRSSVLGVQIPADPESGPVNHFTPLPYAAFMQPRPVFQSSEEKVFNVLERERTVARLLKGGKRQDVRDRNITNITNTSSLSEGENQSQSNVQFRRRKGGKRSDRRKQLRRERIERKRTRRKNRRKIRQKKRNKTKHPKHKKGRKRKLRRGKLKSLGSRERRRQRERKEQIGVNPTMFVEEPDSSDSALLEHPVEIGGPTNSPITLQARDTVQKIFVENHRTDTDESNIAKGGNSYSSSNLNHDSHTSNQGGTVDTPNKVLSTSQSEALQHSSRNSRAYLDVHNYHESNVELDDYKEEDEDILTDMEFAAAASADDSDDYQISPDYFNWKDNSSFDYFTQGEDATVTTDNAWSGPWQVDPSHIQIRRHLVRLHNLLRSKVDPPASNMLALSWHGAAATQARQWAESCMAHRGRDHPSVRWTPRYGACGQNVLVTRRKRRWAHVIRNWWGERRFFNYGSTELRNATYRARSYTQLAWYSSHKVGCGYSECTTASGNTFHRYVCNYCPAGNDPSRLSLPYTRGRPCEMCPNACRSVCPAGQCRLCTNRCQFSDLWANCESLAQRWREWLCNTKTLAGVERFKNCRATCQCALAGDKIL